MDGAYFDNLPDPDNYLMSNYICPICGQVKKGLMNWHYNIMQLNCIFHVLRNVPKQAPVSESTRLDEEGRRKLFAHNHRCRQRLDEEQRPLLQDAAEDEQSLRPAREAKEGAIDRDDCGRSFIEKHIAGEETTVLMG